MDATLGASGRCSNTRHGPTVLRRGNKCGEERQTALAQTVAGGDGPPRRPMRRHSCRAACVDRCEFEDCAAQWPDRWLRVFIMPIRITFLITIVLFFTQTSGYENAPDPTVVRLVERLPKWIRAGHAVAHGCLVRYPALRTRLSRTTRWNTYPTCSGRNPTRCWHSRAPRSMRPSRTRNGNWPRDSVGGVRMVPRLKHSVAPDGRRGRICAPARVACVGRNEVRSCRSARGTCLAHRTRISADCRVVRRARGW